MVSGHPSEAFGSASGDGKCGNRTWGLSAMMRFGAAEPAEPAEFGSAWLPKIRLEPLLDAGLAKPAEAKLSSADGSGRLSAEAVPTLDRVRHKMGR